MSDELQTQVSDEEASKGYVNFMVFPAGGGTPIRMGSCQIGMLEAQAFFPGEVVMECKGEDIHQLRAAAMAQDVSVDPALEAPPLVVDVSDGIPRAVVNVLNEKPSLPMPMITVDGQPYVEEKK